MRDPRARDWWLYPVVVQTGVNDKFRVNETGVGGAGQITVTIPPGIYYTHLSNAYTAFPSLYKTIESLLSVTIAANGYAFEPSTPTLSALQTRNGIRITNPIIEWRIEWPADSIDKRWFGLTNFASNATSVNNGGIWEIQSGHTVSGRWRTTGIGNLDGIATMKRKIPRINATWSHDRPSDRRGKIWHRDLDSTIEYQYVLAGQVMTERAKIASYAHHAGLAPGDTNATFERLWEALAVGHRALCLHDVDQWNGDLFYPDRYIDSHVLRSLGNISMDSAISLKATAGEAYDITLQTAVVHDTAFFGI